MRIKTLELSWFRGAADSITLPLNGKSMVVYGSNGSGKSSFVDAVEYVLEDGKITHLAHEYSGRKQERAVPNTHRPHDRQPELSITFGDNSELKIEIAEGGSYTSSGAEAAAMPTWEYRRTVLRQHEVADFIQSTKGDKYSALLPLLGLRPMEVAAENLRQLAKSVEQESRLATTQLKLKEVATRRRETFGTDNEEQIRKKIDGLHVTYCPHEASTTDALSRCRQVQTAIDTRIAESSADLRRYVVLQDAASLDLEAHIDAVRAASGRLAGTVEPLITEKLEILQSTVAYVDNLKDEKEVDCPACGRPIPVDALETHLNTERQRLSGIIDAFNTRKTAIGTLCNTVRTLQTSLAKPDLKSWREKLADGPIGQSFIYLDGINAETLRGSCGEEQLEAIEHHLRPLIDAAVSSSKNAPPDAQRLSTDRHEVDVAGTVIEADELDVAAKRAQCLTSFINRLEQKTRDEIRTQAKAVIDDISKDIQAMWAILHPDQEIDGVHLYLPDGADKAIDIGLRFYGVEQDSPRLTLSEGYRNSLGLCIFLAMAMREATNDRPVFLDDVVVSLDRNHRGMIAEVLEKKLNARQVIILTHDRDWYTDLRAQLDSKTWVFKTLLPYETPDLGIRWSDKTTTFGDARAHLKERPDSAGNDARKIMDVELATIAERLQIRFPYLRGDKNDKRMAHDFLERIGSDAKKCFQKRSGTSYDSFMSGIEALEGAAKLLVSWGNRASHSPDVVRPEAVKLIDTCERALECFKCSSCGKQVWYANAASPELVQCASGEIRWRYGKG